MTVKRIIAIGGILLVAMVGWGILGSTVFIRSEKFSDLLGGRVESLWGSELRQNAPQFYVKVPGSTKTRSILPIENNVKVDLKVDHRKKGLIWYPVYKCDFEGDYVIQNNEQVTQKVRVLFNFPVPGATYGKIRFAVDGVSRVSSIQSTDALEDIIEVKPGESRTVTIGYTTLGLREWRYSPCSGTGRLVALNMTVVSNTADIDFPDGTLPPIKKDDGDKGYAMTWQEQGLLTTKDIGVIMPEKVNPGPLVGRVTFFAPVCLIFFFVLLAAINIICKIPIHPMHYLFVAAGFFAFHLLFAYLVDHVDLHISFVISTAVTLVMVSGYLRAALGKKFPWKTACGAQVFYLILFSYSFFFTGMTGLTVTIGSIISLAVLMVVTAKTDWNTVFSRKVKPSSSQATEPVPA